jgi:hypothetical protein
MPNRRFPPPWIDDANTPASIVRDKNGQALGYFYFEEEPGATRLSCRLSHSATATVVAATVPPQTTSERVSRSELSDQPRKALQGPRKGLQNPGCIDTTQPRFFHFGRARRRRRGLSVPIQILSIAANQGGDGPNTSRLST